MSPPLSFLSLSLCVPAGEHVCVCTCTEPRRARVFISRSICFAQCVGGGGGGPCPIGPSARPPPPPAAVYPHDAFFRERENTAGLSSPRVPPPPPRLTQVHCENAKFALTGVPGWTDVCSYDHSSLYSAYARARIAVDIKLS